MHINKVHYFIDSELTKIKPIISISSTNEESLIMLENQKKWCITPRINPSAKLRLFCFPYAGGGTTIYSDWADLLPMAIELVCIQPPGRGTHFNTSCINDMELMTSQLASAITPLLDKPFVFFGHSLGSRVAFELAAKLKSLNYNLPNHFIASGSRAPHKRVNKRPIHNLTNKEFIAELKRLNGTPTVILENQELMEFLMPMLRADFEIAYSHQYEGKQKINCPVSIFGGTEDKDVSLDDLNSWTDLFSQENEIQTFKNGHFFIDSMREQVLKSVCIILERVLSKL